MVAIRNLALALAILPDLAWSACQNDDTFEYPSATDLNAMKNCKQIRNNELRRHNMCKIQAVNLACPQSCGVCCDNDNTWEFKLKNSKKMVNCYWLFKNDKKKDARVARYCTKTAEHPLFNYNGRTVRDACPETCGICKSEITAAPTPSPTPVTAVPTLTSAPSASPSSAPSAKPSAQPTKPPSPQPSPFPTLRPTTVPSDDPSDQPSNMPSDQPSNEPSKLPSNEPSKLPSDQPSNMPSMIPTRPPTSEPSPFPSHNHSKERPSDQPSVQPSMDPSQQPSFQPSDQPSQFPSFDPSDVPSHNPTASIKPSASPSRAPVGPTPVPTSVPTPAPTPGCDDSPTFEFVKEYDNSKTYNCAWILKHTEATTDNIRKTKYCPQATINAACCESCIGISVTQP